MPRLFALHRSKDVHARSGVGVVAYGVQFGDGRVVTKFLPSQQARASQITVWDSFREVLLVHGHGHNTQLIWLTAIGDTVLDTAPARARHEAYRRGRASSGGSLSWLDLALACLDDLPGLLDAYQRLQHEHARVREELEVLRAEHAAMQAHLDALAAAQPKQVG